MAVIHHATRSEIEADDEENLCAVHWANCEVANLLKLTGELKRLCNPFDYVAEYADEDGVFTFSPFMSEGFQADTLLGVVEEAIAELLPLTTALIEIRHQLRKQA